MSILTSLKAKRHNIRIAVRSGGHDFLSRSVAPGSLLIWVSSMNDIAIHDEKSFHPNGCKYSIPGPVVKAGAGTRAFDLSAKLDGHHQAFPTGGGFTIGLGGYLTSAGHSILSPRGGLGADLVVEMEMVSPDGDILTLNECQNTDLFWAARGVSITASCINHRNINSV
jgi:FAD/FMN-containing dehydrogenase